ncbi:ATP-binding protein [Sphingomonas sp. MMS24-J13]|uniref:ATP-binding protein n=1 Tax=Sphingomonas sp. MMS24-J13 TaxID=3238686 RepID=UPI003850DD5A
MLVALIILVQSSISQRDAALARKQHSYDVVILTEQVEGSLARAEASLGRFVIDGDRRTGTLYYDEWRHAGTLIDDLAVLTADDPAQMARVDHLRGLYAKRGKELALPATRANYRQGWPALSLFALAGKSDTLPKMTTVLRDIIKAGGALIDQRASAAASRTDQANSLASLLSGVGILLALSVLALAWLVANEMAARRVAAETADIAADRSAALEKAVAARTIELSEANRRLVEEGKTREAAEARLRQVQKMDAVGQLTGGIAHDFNNMLAVVVGGLEMAKLRVEQQAAEAARHIDSAMEGATRAAALTRRLLSFARAEPLLPAAANPGALLRGMSELIDRTIGERIQVRILADADGWPVWVDGYQLENAVLNLAVNARDAMNGAGTIVMRIANVRLRDGEVGALAAGDYVHLSVTDDGTGMSPETLERVFEPFFTTKPVGQGTGLGLSQILGFARQSGGDIAIASTLGEGTTVSIYLPRHRGDTEEQASAPAQVPIPTRIDGTIMVVEDDARVRAATGNALDELGYRTVLCASGAEALERLGDEPIALLLTDVVMPGMTGPELVERVRLRFPNLRVLFVTGYVGEAGEAEMFRDSVVLRKPFTLRALTDALAAAAAQVELPADRAA